MARAMKELGEHRYLRHNDNEIRLTFSLCISQFMRIIIPRLPYCTITMGEVFQLIVDSMVGIDDIGSPTFGRIVKLLELMAQVRSCIAMLDFVHHDMVL